MRPADGAPIAFYSAGCLDFLRAILLELRGPAPKPGPTRRRSALALPRRAVSAPLVRPPPSPPREDVAVAVSEGAAPRTPLQTAAGAALRGLKAGALGLQLRKPRESRAAAGRTSRRQRLGAVLRRIVR